MEQQVILATLILTALSHVTSGSVCKLDATGKEYVVSFMDHYRDDSSCCDPVLEITSINSSIQVNVTAPRFSTYQPDHMVDVPERSVTHVTVNNQLRMVKSQKFDKVLRVVSEDDFVLSGISSRPSSTDAFLAFQTKALGRDYYTVSQWPLLHGSQIGIVAAFPYSVIKITIPFGRGITFEFDGELFREGDILNVILEENQSLHIIDYGHDMSGTRVQSTKPIAVYSGNTNAYTVGQNDDSLTAPKSYIVAQLPPIVSWGHQVLVVPLPNSRQNYLKIIAEKPETTVQITAENSFQRFWKSPDFSGGHSEALLVLPANLLNITSDAPIMVTQFSESYINYSDPAMVVHPPVDLYKNEYVFSGGDLDSNANYVLVTIESGEIEGLQLNGQFIAAKNFSEFPDGVMSGGPVLLTPGYNILTHIDSNVTFGAVVYGTLNGSKYLYPAGTCLDRINSPCKDKFLVFEDHTACLPSSSDLRMEGLPENMISLILAQHNQYRSEVDPTAANMIAMRWDEELAMVAQKWASSCPVASSPNDEPHARIIPGRFSEVGQNVAMNLPNWNKAMNSWSEDPLALKRMTWAESSRVGCGYAKCGGRDIFVCNYAPGDIDYTSYPYVIGSSCHMCQESCDNKKLCAYCPKVCYNGGTLDIGKCTCTCRHPFYTGDLCELDCNIAVDSHDCESQSGTKYTSDMCITSAEARYDCPWMCNNCPEGDVSLTGSVAFPQPPLPTEMTTEMTTETTTLPEVKTTESHQFPPNTTDTDLKCRADEMGTAYRGKMDKTRGGVVCQRWDSPTLLSYGHNDVTKFPDDTLEDAANYCRNPDSNPAGPWCYTTDPDIPWDYCNIPYCTDCGCPSVLVTGSSVHKDLIGIYKLHDCHVSERPAYVHSGGLVYLYYDDDDQMWVFASSFKRNETYLLVKDPAMTPYDVTGRWRITETSSPERISVECVCSHTVCRVLEMDTDYPEHRISGEFIFFGSDNGRYYYKNTNLGIPENVMDPEDIQGLYLYFLKRSGCSYWTVGPTMFGTDSILYAYDLAVVPDNIKATWHVAVSGQGWVNDTSLRFKCVDRNN